MRNHELSSTPSGQPTGQPANQEPTQGTAQQERTTPLGSTMPPAQRYTAPNSGAHRPLFLIMGCMALLILVLLVIIIAQNARQQASLGAFPETAQHTSVPRTATRTFSVGDQTQLIIKAYGGDISVHTTPAGQITIIPRVHGTTMEANPRNVRLLSNQGQDAQGHEQLTVTPDPWFQTVDLAVTIPPSASISITTGSGSIDVHGGTGATIQTGSGSLFLDNIQGPVHARTDSGDVVADALTGMTTLASQSGSLRLNTIHGQLTATTSSGDVDVHSSTLSKQSLLQTVNGSVHFDGNLGADGSDTMQTTNGDVDVTLPATAAFALTANTASGSVQNAFNATVVGNAPRTQLNLSTQHGSINLSAEAS